VELNAAGVRVPRQESQTPSLLDKARPLAEWARPEDCERGEGAEGVVVLDGHDDPDAHPPVIEDMLALLVLGQQAREAGGYGAALLAVDFHQGFSPSSGMQEVEPDAVGVDACRARPTRPRGKA